MARLIPRIPAIRTQLNFKLRRNSMSSTSISTQGLPTLDLEQTKLYHNELTTNLLTAIIFFKFTKSKLTNCIIMIKVTVLQALLAVIYKYRSKVTVIYKYRTKVSYL